MRPRPTDGRLALDIRQAGARSPDAGATGRSAFDSPLRHGAGRPPERALP